MKAIIVISLRFKLYEEEEKIKFKAANLLWRKVSTNYFPKINCARRKYTNLL